MDGNVMIVYVLILRYNGPYIFRLNWKERNMPCQKSATRGIIDYTSEFARTLIVPEYVGAFHIIMGPAPTCPAFHPDQGRGHGALGAHDSGRRRWACGAYPTKMGKWQEKSFKKRHIITTTEIFGEIIKS